jgi:hypothetical protein
MSKGLFTRKFFGVRIIEAIWVLFVVYIEVCETVSHPPQGYKARVLSLYNIMMLGPGSILLLVG